jgi:hypothetical protein
MDDGDGRRHIVDIVSSIQTLVKAIQPGGQAGSQLAQTSDHIRLQRATISTTRCRSEQHPPTSRAAPKLAMQQRVNDSNPTGSVHSAVFTAVRTR